MTATLPEQLRNFHITGHGLDDAVPVLTVDAVTAGNLLMWTALDASKTVNNGDTFKINAGDLDVTVA